MNNLLEQYSSGWLGDGADCQKLCRGCSAILAGDAAGLTGWQKRAPKLRSNNQTTDQATKNPAGAGVQLTRACFPAPAGQNHIKLS